MNRVVHFEIHAKNQDQIQQFYEKVFGWSFQDLGPQMGNYRVVDTSNGPDGASAAGINGGLNPRQGASPVAGAPVNAFVCTIEVADIDGTIAKIAEAGGTVALPKMEIPGVGWLAYHHDTDGNIFGIMQPFAS
jgi:hypothetical protein